MKRTFTLAIAKTAAKLSRVLGRGGGQALPGLVAERLDSMLARDLAAKLPHGVILVTGTNGKTTTTKLLASVLEAKGERVLTNRTGSNLRRGVWSALIAAADRRGRIRDTIGLFEVDEASLRQVAAEVQPSHIVVLNLFRDQLDRYGELDTTAAMIGQGIAATQAQLYLNADDPLVASLSKYAAKPDLVTYFGIEGLPAKAASAHATVSDSDRCPVCRTRLRFSRVFYGHIGHYKCPQGDFARPQPRVAVVKVDQSDLGGSRFELAVEGKRSEIRTTLPGTYNLYNALAALAVGAGVGMAAGVMATALVRTDAAFGRVERVEVRGRTLYLLLIKNPAGFTQVIETFLTTADRPAMLVAINDLDADGRDVSWLWDVPVEALGRAKPRLMTSGIRAADMALRLHYAGLEAVSEPGLERALQTFIDQLEVGATGYVLPTYTAMLALRKLLESQAGLQEVWK